jgi:hypothetical protein
MIRDVHATLHGVDERGAGTDGSRHLLIQGLTGRHSSKPEPGPAAFLSALPGYRTGMELSLLLIVIGIIIAVLVNYALGIVCILIGLVLLVWPRLRSSV